MVVLQILVCDKYNLLILIPRNSILISDYKHIYS